MRREPGNLSAPFRNAGEEILFCSVSELFRPGLEIRGATAKTPRGVDGRAENAQGDFGLFVGAVI